MISKLRMIVQFFSFAVLNYGGRIGINLGFSLPCFACPFVSGCGGYCFLFYLQRVGLFGAANWSQIFTYPGLKTILWFILFAVLVMLLSKTWCGWICPFGTMQDWLTMLRKKLGIREIEWSWKTYDTIKPLKYLFLGVILVVPLLIAYGGMHQDFYLLFCRICPGRTLLPLFAGQTRFFSLDFANDITLVISVISIIIAAITVVGSFFKERFFCLFCPMLPLIQMFKKYSLITFEKKVDTCSGCGNCLRMCPMDVREVHEEKEKAKVMSPECLLCMKCVESCPEDKTLTIKFLQYKIFTSSREYITKNFK